MALNRLQEHRHINIKENTNIKYATFIKILFHTQRFIGAIFEAFWNRISDASL